MSWEEHCQLQREQPLNQQATCSRLVLPLPTHVRAQNLAPPREAEEEAEEEEEKEKKEEQEQNQEEQADGVV
jgi:hypothetical protein